MSSMRTLIVLLAALFVTACASSSTAPNRSSVDTLIDSWHQSASVANETAYFDAMSENGVFMGTDATERWTRAEFREWAKPFFARGRAWTFTSRSRRVMFSEDGRVAWFDEVLDSASYGECRGTGVAQLRAGVWKIEHYNLTIPIPNDLADKFVAEIRKHQAPAR